ncbi:MAG: zinc ribbon domain-containing protein [bacterium]|nr:zinc ribbon domain-containing protein [bacterium]
MPLMDCPYRTDGSEALPANLDRGPGCGRVLKPCSGCGSSNRAFAVFCRSCGEELAESGFSWPGSRGGVRRCCVNPFPIPNSPPQLALQPLASLKLPARCRYLLAEDGYLFAFSIDGHIQVIDSNRPQAPGFSFTVAGKLYAEPVIHHGTLYVGIAQDETKDRGRLEAYNLGGLYQGKPTLRKQWSVPVKGIPTQALLVFENRLYYKVGFNDSHREIQVAEPLNSQNPEVSMVYHGYRVSAPVADPLSRQVYFLSARDEELVLNTFLHSFGPSPRLQGTPVLDGVPDFLEHVPTALAGNRMFTIFGHEGWLSCIDLLHSRFERRLYKKVKQFSIRSAEEIVVIDSSGVFFPLHNNREHFIPGESTMCPIISLADRAAVIGLRDGKLRFYKPDTPSVQNEFRVFDSTADEITTMATFENKIAVGNQRGAVKLFALK